MYITKIRKNGKKLTTLQLEDLAIKLNNAVKRKGFVTQICYRNSTSLKIGLWQCSFKVDINKLGYNARYSLHSTSLKGYVRTSTPTWEQRVEFNNILNNILNKNHIDCNVKSGPFLIRHGATSYEECDWRYQKPDYMLQNEARGYKVISLPTSHDSHTSKGVK